MKNTSRKLINAIKTVIMNNPKIQRALYLGTGYGVMGFQSQIISWLEDDKGLAYDYDGVSAIWIRNKVVAYLDWHLSEQGVEELEIMREPNERVRIYLS